MTAQVPEEITRTLMANYRALEEKNSMPDSAWLPSAIEEDICEGGKLNRKKLQPHVDQWVERGLIQPDQGEAILQSYPARGRNYWMLAFVIIGSLLLLSGVILVIASNWEAIPDLTKFVTLLILLAGSMALGIETRRREAHPAFWETGFLLAAFFPLLGLMLISQTFHLYGDPTFLFTAWAVAIAPLPFLTRTISTWVVWVASLFSVLICLGIHHIDDFNSGCLSWMAMGAGLAVASGLWKKIGGTVQAGIGEYWGILTFFIAGYIWGFDGDSWFLKWLGLFLASLGLIYLGYQREKGHQVNIGFVIVALIILSVFFRLVGNMMNTGLIFLSGGAAIIATVWGLNRVRRSLAAHAGDSKDREETS